MPFKSAHSAATFVAMRGIVLNFDPISGAGLISGDDGRRYEFSRDDLANATVVRSGIGVDFVASGEKALRVVRLDLLDEPAALDEVAPPPRPLSLLGRYLNGLRRYADFKGRSSRLDYLCFQLPGFVIGLALIIAGLAIAEHHLGELDELERTGAMYASVALYVVPTLIPTWAILVRRLHDCGWSGWISLVVFIPIVGSFFPISLALIPSQKGENRFGPQPV